MIIPPAIAAIFDLFPRKARFAKEKESPEFTSGKKAGFDEGQRSAYKQIIANSAELSHEEYQNLIQYLASRNLMLTYDITNGGFAVRKLKQEFIDQAPGPIIRPKRFTVKLKSKQRIPQLGKWEFTLRGVKELYPTDLVCFYSLSLKTAIESIDINEIEDFKID